MTSMKLCVVIPAKERVRESGLCGLGVIFGDGGKRARRW
jgi:hypothetical protein